MEKPRPRHPKIWGRDPWNHPGLMPVWHVPSIMCFWLIQLHF